MNESKGFRERWRSATVLERIVTVVHFFLCTAVLVMAILRLLSVVESMVFLFLPMSGMLFTQAYLFRKDNRASSIASLICGCIVLFCSIAILLLEMVGG